MIRPDELTAERLKPMAVAVLANVTSLNPSVVEALRQFAQRGHGVLFTLGNRVEADRYREMFPRGANDLFPCRLESLANEQEGDRKGVRVANGNFDLPWLQPFRSDRGGSLKDARWSHWWKISLFDAQPLVSNPNRSSSGAGTGSPADSKTATMPVEEQIPLGSTVVEVRLSNGDPLIVSRQFGRGIAELMTSTLDADWTTFPAKPDYVPFLYEQLFSLATQGFSRNVDVGSPLIMPAKADWNVDGFQFLTPAGNPMPAKWVDDQFQPTFHLQLTESPGIYQFASRNQKAQQAIPPEYFVVNFDRSESDVTPLSEEQREQLSIGQRMTFANDLPELRRNMFNENSRTEFWWLLIYLFLLFLAVETWMTRRMIRGGFAESVE